MYKVLLYMKLTTTNNNKNVKSVYQKVIESRFHEVCLWAWVTSARNANSKITVREAIMRYQAFFGLNEDSLDSEIAWITYYRMNRKVMQAHGDIKKTKSNNLMEGKVTESDLLDIKKELEDIGGDKVSEVIKRIDEQLQISDE